MRVGEIRQFCKVGEEGQRLMQAAMSQLNLSARAYQRILKLARRVVYLANVLRSNCPSGRGIATQTEADAKLRQYNSSYESHSTIYPISGLQMR